MGGVRRASSDRSGGAGKHAGGTEYSTLFSLSLSLSLSLSRTLWTVSLQVRNHRSPHLHEAVIERHPEEYQLERCSDKVFVTFEEEIGISRDDAKYPVYDIMSCRI